VLYNLQKVFQDYVVTIMHFIVHGVSLIAWPFGFIQTIIEMYLMNHILNAKLKSLF